MPVFEANYVAILLAAVAAFVLGFLWHGPIFGKVWMQLSGMGQQDIDKAKAEGGMCMTMVYAFISLLVVGYVLAYLIAATGALDVMAAVLLAFWIWLGFIAMILLNGVLWEKRTLNLYLFNIVYHLVSLCLMAAVIAWWK